MGGSSGESNRGDVIVKAGAIDIDAAGNLDLKSTTMDLDATTLTLEGASIKVKDKAKNHEYDLIKHLEDGRRRLEAIEQKDSDQSTNDELTRTNSEQIEELWQILQMMQKHYIQLMKTTNANISD